MPASSSLRPRRRSSPRSQPSPAASRLQSGVTVLSVLDPVRVAEDYATIDQLSRGRLELVIGKGNEVLQYPVRALPR